MYRHCHCVWIIPKTSRKLYPHFRKTGHSTGRCAKASVAGGVNGASGKRKGGTRHLEGKIDTNGGRARRGERIGKGRRRRHRWGRVIMPVACTVAQRRPKPAITHHILNSSASGQHLACHLLLLPLRRLYFLLPSSPVAGSLLCSLIFLVFAPDAGESSSLLRHCLCSSFTDLVIYIALIEIPC